MDYDSVYRKTDHYFGADPDPLLVRFYSLLERRHRVLDMGAGQGRHTFFLARSGFEVDAVDVSAEAVKAVTATAAREGLPVRAYHSGFDRFFPRSDRYGGVLLFGLLQTLAWDQIDFLIEMVRLWCAAGGLIFVTAWNTTDPSYEECRATWKTLGRNSFRAKSGEIRTFFSPGEILKVFPDFDVIHHWEGQGPLHRHGDEPPERHGRVEAVFKAI